MKDYPEGLPCWAPGAADYLARILTGEEIAVEWGGGASSIWLAPKVKWLHTIEHSADWAERIIAGIAGIEHFTLHSHPYLDDAYVECVDEFDYAGLPTLWLIDGYRRIDCLEKAKSKATPGDILVCDDARDYAAHVRAGQLVHTFAMPHPHAGLPCTSAKNTRDRNTVRTHAPKTKETWIWRV